MTLYDVILLIWCLFALISFCFLLVKPAPYGRHSKKDTEHKLNGAIGWVIMELPAVLVFAFIYFKGPFLTNKYILTLFILWEMHYVHRTFIFPIRRKKLLKPMPLYIVGLGMFFNVINAFLISYWITFQSKYSEKTLLDPLFLIGIVLFVLGYLINMTSDEKLLKLRQQHSEYNVPKGGLFDYVSCPNYLGEVIEWLGFALVSLSPAAFAFVLWTAANLIPRALSHHAWYRSHFPHYPKKRKAIFPFLL